MSIVLRGDLREFPIENLPLELRSVLERSGRQEASRLSWSHQNKQDRN